MSVQLLSSSGSSTEEPVPLARAEAVLCDMDGTLVDSSAVVESMWASFAHDHGMSELTAEEQAAVYKRFARGRCSAGPGDLRIADFTTH